MIRGTISLYLGQIAPSPLPVAHARTCCEDFCVCREGENPEMFDAFGPQQPTTKYAHVSWNLFQYFRRNSSSLSEV